MSVVVTRADLYRVELPLVHHFRTSSHDKTHLAHLLVRLEASDGAVGWGECASPSDPFYVGETVETCWHVLRTYLLPGLLGRAWEHPHDAAALLARVRGNEFAHAGVETAAWDLWARRHDLPLAKALGGTRTSITSGVSLGIEPSLDALVERVGEFVAQGYARIKLKIAPGWDLEPVAAVRERFGDVPLQVDANGAYPVTAATRLVDLDRFDLLMVEQPFAPGELTAHAWLQGQLTTPVCLDESITSPGIAAVALDLGAARIVNVKVSRLGGLGAAVAVHDLCHERGIPVWCGGMHEFGVGRAANVALASLPGFSLPGDISGSDKYYARDVVDPAIVAVDGEVAVPWDRPGTGHDVDEAVLAEHVVAHEEFRA